MKLRITLGYDPDVQAFSAICPELPGCASAGDTEEEAKQNIKEAIELYLTPSNFEFSRSAVPDGGDHRHGADLANHCEAQDKDNLSE